MAKKFLYFQPEYVNRFKCTGGGCLNNCCCRPWTIDIDAKTYEQYSHIEPTEAAKEILSHISRGEPEGQYFLKERPCPFLTENCLCGLQLKYGEDFLSVTCATYPRVTSNFGKFFERSLTLTCPVAAEMILFAQEPLKFEFVEVPEKIHSNGGKIGMHMEMKISDTAAELLLENQVTMISILQERTLTLDQRLIVLCFFADKLEEIYLSSMDADKQRKLIAAYESKKFWEEQVPLMLQSVTFDAEKFIALMINVINSSMGILRLGDGQKFLVAFEKVLGIKPNENNQVSPRELAANYKSLTKARKKFLAEYSPFLENYLVNELFMNLYPWKHNRCPTRSLSVFLMSYKVFELLMFSSVQNHLSDKNDLLMLTDWYSNQIDHADNLKEKFFAYLEEHKDFFELMDTLLEP